MTGFLCLAAVLATAQQYNMVTLGFAGFAGQSGGYTGLNNYGDMVGYDSWTNAAFLYTGGVVTSLGLGYGDGMAIKTAAVILKQIPHPHSRRPAQVIPWHSMRMVVRVIPFELFDKTSSVRIAINNDTFQICDLREILQAFQGYTRAQRRVVGSTS